MGVINNTLCLLLLLYIIVEQVFVARDPRFDDLSGEFNETYFKQSYGFLSDIRLREKQVLVLLSSVVWILLSFTL